MTDHRSADLARLITALRGSYPMSIRLRRPGVARLEELLDACVGEAMTYGPVGVSLDEAVATSLHRARWETVLDGQACFERGSAAICNWAVHRGSGLTVLADGPLAVGTNVAIVAPLPLGFVEITCRVVAVIDEPGVFGFAYGTLPVHPERGEESFILTGAPDGTVRFVVAAASEPAHPLARLASPIAARLQDRAGLRYLAAMQRVARAP